MRRYRVFALGFGAPRPMHRMVLANWSACDVLQVVLLTDSAAEWRDHLPRACTCVEVVETTLHNYFTRGARALGFSSAAALMDAHGGSFFDSMNGWTACGLRGLLHLMWPPAEDATYTHHGWIDSDVLLDAQLLRRHLFAFADRDLLLFTPSGPLFEQCKLLHRRVDALAAYRDLLARPVTPAVPMEARYVYHLRGCNELSRDVLSPSRIAVHWKYTDESDEGAEFRKHVSASQDHQLHDVMTGERLLMLVADSEVKYLPYERLPLLFHVSADIMSTAHQRTNM